MKVMLGNLFGDYIIIETTKILIDNYCHDVAYYCLFIEIYSSRLVRCFHVLSVIVFDPCQDRRLIDITDTGLKTVTKLDPVSK